MICPHCGSKVMQESQRCNTCGHALPYAEMRNLKPAPPLSFVNEGENSDVKAFAMLADRIENQGRGLVEQSSRIARLSEAVETQGKRQRILIGLTVMNAVVGLLLIAAVLFASKSVSALQQDNQSLEERVATLQSSMDQLRQTVEIQKTPEPTPVPNPDRTLRFDSNLATVPDEGTVKNTPEPITRESGASVVIPSEKPEHMGYSFEKWTTEKDGTGRSYAPGEVIILEADTVLYAQWQLESPISLTSDSTPSPESSARTGETSGNLNPDSSPDSNS